MISIIKKFDSLFTHEREKYVNAARVLDEYRKIKGNSRATQVPMINDLKLDYIIVVRRGKKAGNILNIDINTGRFKSSTMNVFVKASQLAKHKKLNERIKQMPDINDDADSDETIEVSTDSNESTETDELSELDKSNNFSIIELEDHEQFTDADGNVFNIEIRGERTKDKIYFKAKDVEQFFGITRLTEYMLRNDRDRVYHLNIDYIICGLHKPDNVGKMQLHDVADPNINSDQKQRINHSNIYLTLTGLIRVIFTSRSGNENILKTMDWIVGLVYTHKFGSEEERHELAKDLFKHILNDKISGLYYVDIGPLNKLYDTMNISRETYPPETYGDHHLGKYGLSENIQSRIADHKNKTNGYGRWSKTIVHKYSVMLAPSQLSDAVHLSKYY